MNNNPTAPRDQADRLAANRQLVDKRIATFHRLPTLATKLLAVINDQNVDVMRIVENMRFDPGVTANVLKLANSAYFGMPRRVGSVNEAVVRLGVKRLFDLVVATGMGSILKKPFTAYGLQPEQLLQHSAWVAAASEEFCRILGLSQPDLMFTAGILHDVGKVVLADILSDSATEIQAMAETAGMPFDKIEEQIAGMSHAEAGARVLDRWNFPKELTSAVRLHHSPGAAGSADRIAAIIHVSDALAYAQGAGTGLDGMSYVVSQETVAQLGLKNRDVEYVASVTLDKMLELQDILRG